jgi:thiol-disulfide isomerase/thioredoxin
MKQVISRTARTMALLIPLATAGGLLLAPARSIIAAPAHSRAASSRLTAVDAAGLRRKLAALKGKVVVLNVWATWCGPCVMEFPDLVKFERAYRSRGVTVIGLSMDDPRKAQQIVPPFLAQRGAQFTVYAMKPVDPGTVIGVIDKNWQGALPTTYVLDRSGHVRTVLVGARSLTDFEGAVQMALKG